ncbi:MAG TPA: FCD domain-containing protein, partial [Pyrinomonadaceae bacterium]|nr:FCD domain-containing protein [Pyrinomonadaceae bacterium]
DFNEALDLHRRIYRAIRARNSEEAREAMREHIVRAQKAFALEEAQNRTERGSAGSNSFSSRDKET